MLENRSSKTAIYIALSTPKFPDIRLNCKTPSPRHKINHKANKVTLSTSKLSVTIAATLTRFKDVALQEGELATIVKKESHFAHLYCRKKTSLNTILNMSAPRQSQTGFEPLSFESIYLESLNQENSADKQEVYATVSVEISRKGNAKTTLNAKIDTGAQGNVLPLRISRQMFPRNINEQGLPKPGALHPSDAVLVAYGGSKVQHMGIVTISCSYDNKEIKTNLYVTETPGPAIIGVPTATDQDLLKFNLEIKEHPERTTTAPNPSQSAQPKNCKKQIQTKRDLIAQYPDCFKGTGKFKGDYHITLDPSVPPVVHPPRRVPLSLKDDVKKELDEI